MINALHVQRHGAFCIVAVRWDDHTLGELVIPSGELAQLIEHLRPAHVEYEAGSFDLTMADLAMRGDKADALEAEVLALITQRQAEGADSSVINTALSNIVAQIGMRTAVLAGRDVEAWYVLHQKQVFEAFAEIAQQRLAALRKAGG